MTDIFDRATECEEADREATLSEARYQRDQERARPSAEECRLCGERIPIARRRAVPGVQTCIECQQELEYATVCGGD